MHLRNRIATNRWLLLLVGLAAVHGGHLHAQTQPSWDPTGRQLTRTELEQLLTQYEQTAASPEYSGTLRERARKEAELIRQRLVDGDLRVGDQVLLHVEGQQPLSNTFMVVSGRLIILPELGQVPLEGVLRSELQAHMTEFIGRFIRDPIVRAQTLVRIEILGAVGRPGFYTLASDLLLSDVLMQAGGPQANTDLEKIRIERSNDVIWDGEQVREAMIEGLTLDQLSIRAGDSIYVPGTSQSRFLSLRSIMGIASGLVSLVFLARRAGIF